MDLSTIAGWLFGGFATRLYVAGGAVWVASEAAHALTPLARAFSAMG